MKREIRTLLSILFVIGCTIVFTSGCKKGDDNIVPGTVKDIDGNVYHTVTIGTQVWMVENLQVTKYRNGDLLPNVIENGPWGNLTIGAFCNYNDEAAMGTKYGKLYNWYAVNDPRKIAPAGWHIASDAEWTTLEENLKINHGTPNGVVNSLAAQTDWEASTDYLSLGYDLTRNNTSGFTALPGGFRFVFEEYRNLGGYQSKGVTAGWWSTDESDATKAWERILTIYWDELRRASNFKGCGFSVRCVKD
ncbi:MAG TPA: fibrobacter succinogenes major paralogous domain-containing protein [Prolixibacteraceae bacterium]|jgi:uncharacterized protein (TIGR02145 family)